MVWPIRAWLGLIRYERALLWLWGHCPPSLLVGGARAPGAPPVPTPMLDSDLKELDLDLELSLLRIRRRYCKISEVMS